MKFTKYLLSLGLVTAATLPLTTMTSQAATTAVKEATITKAVYVRASTTPNSKKLGQIAKGETVKVYNTTKYWAEIKFNDKKAYISLSHIKFKTAKKATATKKTTTNYVVKEGVTFREAANKNAKSLGTYKVGDQLNVVSIDKNGWAKVKVSDKKYVYVYKTFISKKAATSNVTKMPAKTTTSTPKAEVKSTSYTVVSPVTYREAANVYSKDLDTYKAGDQLNVVSIDKNGWAKVKVSDKKYVYVYKTFIKKTSTLKNYVAKKASTGFEKASKSSKKVIAIKQNTKVIVAQEGKTWFKAIVNGKSVYILKTDVKKA